MFEKEGRKRIVNFILDKLKFEEFEDFLFAAKNYALTVSLWYFLVISLLLVAIIKMKVLRE